MPQLLNENEVSYYLGEKHIYPKVEGGGSNIFIYELDISDIDTRQPGTYYIQDENLAPAIHAAITSGKQVYIKLQKNDYPTLGAIMTIMLYFRNDGTIADMGTYAYQFYEVSATDNDVSGYVLSVTLLEGYPSINSLSISKFNRFTSIVDHGTSDTTFALTPNVYHKWGTVSSLTLTLATPSDNTILNEYMFMFESGSTPTVFSLTGTGLKWDDNIDTSTWTTEANTTYEFHIANNIVRVGGAK